jgi:hypothetical protein
MGKNELRELIKAKLHKELSEESAEALWSCYRWNTKTKCYKIRKTSPRFKEAPHAWAAWNGFNILSSFGGSAITESVVGTLMLADESTRKIWDEVSDFRIALEKKVRSASLTD